MSQPDEPHLIVVGGGGEGTHTLPRAYFEATGLKADVLAPGTPRLLEGSRILNLKPNVDIKDDRALAQALGDAAKEHEGPTLLVATSSDLLDRLLQVKNQPPDQVIIPYASPDKLWRASDKVEFARICSEVGVPHPDTVTVGRGVVDLPDDASAPAYLKPVDELEWGPLSFEGKRKVYSCKTLFEAESCLREARENGCAGRFVLQQEIPGGDEQMRVLTLYRDRSGQVTVAHGGKVALHTHGPLDEGVSQVILTGPLPESERDAARILQHFDWRGFASSDVKVDPRSGVGYFLELNPRTSATTHYVTAAGVNPYEAWRNDWVLDRQGEALEPTKRISYSSVSRGAIRDAAAPETRAEMRGLPVRHPLLNWRDLALRRSVLGRTVRAWRHMQKRSESYRQRW